MTPDEMPRSREELAEDVAARLRARGLDAARDGENVTVHEHAKTAAAGDSSTRKTILTVLGVTAGGVIMTLVASLVAAILFFGAFAYVGDRLFKR
jgi:hypothetical protein